MLDLPELSSLCVDYFLKCSERTFNISKCFFIVHYVPPILIVAGIIRMVELENLRELEGMLK